VSYKGNDGLNDAFAKRWGKSKSPLIDIIPEEILARDIFGCENAKTVYEWRRNYGLPFIPLGRDTYYSETQVYRWLLSLQKQIVKDPGNGGEIEIPIIYRTKDVGKVKKVAKLKKGGEKP